MPRNGMSAYHRIAVSELGFHHILPRCPQSPELNFLRPYIAFRRSVPFVLLEVYASLADFGRRRLFLHLDPFAQVVHYVGIKSACSVAGSGTRWNSLHLPNEALQTVRDSLIIVCLH